MLAQSETIKKTRLFGLNTYEAKIWVALLSREISTAGELSDIANVPRSRSYDVLESLEKKGFVIMKLGKPIKYLAVPPKEVLENIKKKVECDMVSFLGNMDGLGFGKMMEGLQEIHEKGIGEHDNMVAIIKGRDNIYKHLFYLLNNSKKDVFLSFGVSNSLLAKSIEKIKPTPNISLKIINIKTRACVTDDSNVLIFPMPEEEIHPDYDICIWIKNRNIAKFLKSLMLIKN